MSKKLIKFAKIIIKIMQLKLKSKLSRSVMLQRNHVSNLKNITGRLIKQEKREREEKTEEKNNITLHF